MGLTPLPPSTAIHRSLTPLQDCFKVKRPIRITLNKCFLKIVGCPIWERGRQKGTWGGGLKMSFLYGTSLTNAPSGIGDTDITEGELSINQSINQSINNCLMARKLTAVN